MSRTTVSPANKEGRKFEMHFILMAKFHRKAFIAEINLMGICFFCKKVLNILSSSSSSYVQVASRVQV